MNFILILLLQYIWDCRASVAGCLSLSTESTLFKSNCYTFNTVNPPTAIQNKTCTELPNGHLAIFTGYEELTAVTAALPAFFNTTSTAGIDTLAAVGLSRKDDAASVDDIGWHLFGAHGIEYPVPTKAQGWMLWKLIKHTNATDPLPNGPSGAQCLGLYAATITYKNTPWDDFLCTNAFAHHVCEYEAIVRYYKAVPAAQNQMMKPAMVIGHLNNTNEGICAIHCGDTNVCQGFTFAAKVTAPSQRKCEYFRQPEYINMTHYKTIHQFEDTHQPRPAITNQIDDDFKQHGFIIIRNLFSTEEIDKLSKTLNNADDFQKSTFVVTDQKASNFKQNQWVEPGTDMIGRLSGNAKVYGIAKQLLGGISLYMLNGKYVNKPANQGGEVMWHQDFGDWFSNFNFITVIVAMTKSDRENGGLQIIDQGHKYGRPFHRDVDAQSTLQGPLIDAMLMDNKLVYVDLAKGDGVFFHGNMPHKSDPNKSQHQRANIIFNFNSLENLVDKTAAKFVNLKGEYPVFNALPGEYDLHEFDANSIKDCNDFEMHKRRFLSVKAENN